MKSKQMSVLLEKKKKKSNWLHLLIRNNIPKDKPTMMIIRGFDRGCVFRRSKSIRDSSGKLSRTMNNNKRKGYKGIRHVVRCSMCMCFFPSRSLPLFDNGLRMFNE